MRFIAICVTVVLTLSFEGCGKKDKKESKTSAAEQKGYQTSSNQFQDPTYQQPLLVPPQTNPQNQPPLTPEPDPLNRPYGQQPNPAPYGQQQQHLNPAPPNQANAASSLIVVIGGNASCEKQFEKKRPNTIFTSFDKMVKKLGKKYKIYLDDNVIFACYYKDSEKMVYTRGNGESQETQQQNLASVVLANSTPETSVTIIGFSYGGWRAMVLTHELIRQNYRNQVLFTIDPISRNCKNPRDDACSEAPQDLAPYAAEIAENTIRWVNFYQKLPPLHSDKIRDADFNYRIRLRAHPFLDTSLTVWKRISDHFLELSSHFDQPNYNSWN